MKGNRIISIKFKLIIYVVLLILTSSITLSFISIQRTSENIKDQAKITISLMANDASKLAVSRLNELQVTLEAIALIPNMDSMDWELQKSIMEKQIDNTNFKAMAVVYPDGSAFYLDGTVSQLGDRDYVKKAYEGISNISDLILSRVTNEVVLMHATPIKKGGQVVGVLIGRSDGNTLSLITDDIGYGERGYSYIVNKSGTIVAHPDRAKVMDQFNPIELSESDESLTLLADVFKKIITEKTGVGDYTFEGRNLIAGYEAIEGSEWVFVITAIEEEILSVIPEIQKVIIRAMLIILAISIVLVYLIGGSITNPVIRAVKHSNKIANHDLTENVPVKLIKRKDEIGDLGQAMQIITDNLRATINEITMTSEQVLYASEELSVASQQSAAASLEISHTVQEIAKGAFNQAESTQEGSINANELGRIIEEDQEYIKNLNIQSDKVIDAVSKGLVEIDNLYSITEENNKATSEIKDVIIQTNDSSQRIGNASNIILSIAQQTNLLALNAAIEAARAGSAGKGFAVVAEEIKNLALQSSASTKEIDAIVNELQINAQNAVKTMERISVITEEQTKSVVTSRDRYQLIDHAMKDTKETVNQLIVSGDNMDKMKDVILASMENLSAIAEENSAASQQTTASIEEQAASAEEISATSESLTTLAQSLQALILKFKLAK